MAKDLLKDEVKHYIRALEDYHWNTVCLYDARIRLGDIAKDFQPVKSIPTDNVKLENAKYDPTLFIYEKMEREKEVKQELERAQLSLNEVYKILEYIKDVTEKQFILDLYTNTYFKNKRNKVAIKYYMYDFHLNQKAYRIVRKAVKRIKKDEKT